MASQDKESRCIAGSDGAADDADFIAESIQERSASALYRANSRQHSEILLSPRECAVLVLISCGLSNKSIARELKVAPETIKTHTKNILVKFHAKNRAEAVAIGLASNQWIRRATKPAIHARSEVGAGQARCGIQELFGDAE
jgi:DNA-binding NarL/FixJ family response regulator